MNPHSIAARSRRRLTRAAMALAVALTAGACLTAAGPAHAADTLDQQQTGVTKLLTNLSAGGPAADAQTFTAGVTGGLDRVDLYLGAVDNDSPLTVEIRNVSAGVPGNDVLGTHTFDATEIPVGHVLWLAATFSPAVPVTAGTQYAIVAYIATRGDGTPQYYLLDNGDDAYAGGQTLIGSTSSGPWQSLVTDDLAFRTYVEPAPVFAFTGFTGPVDNPPTVNSVKAGAGVPVKFSLAGDQGLDILAAGSPSSQPIACDSGAPISAIEETVSAGDSGLQYDPISDLYTYVWKTDKTWAGSCRQLTVRLSDGTEHTARFQLR